MIILLFTWYMALALPNSGTAGLEIVKVRDLYYKASTDENSCEELENYLAGTPKISPHIILGYKGVSQMLKAKYAWNPVNKLSYFNAGKRYLDAAIESSKQNVELRFLRFAVQNNAPGILNYSDNINSDKKLILASFTTLTDADLKKRIKDYITSCDSFTKQEKSVLNE